MSDDDITEAIAPKSDQLDAIELEPGPRIFRITGGTVKTGAEQPISVNLEGFPRVWRPSKTQARLLAHRQIWNVARVSGWVGKWVELKYDPTIPWAGKPVGGIVVSRVSGIDKPQDVILPGAKNQPPKTWHVEPLPRADVLRAEWKHATPERRAEIEAEVKQLETTRDEFDRANGGAA